MDCRAIRFDCTYAADYRECFDERRALSFGSTRPLCRVPRRTTAEMRVPGTCEDRLNHFSPRSLGDLQRAREVVPIRVRKFFGLPGVESTESVDESGGVDERAAHMNDELKHRNNQRKHSVFGTKKSKENYSISGRSDMSRQRMNESIYELNTTTGETCTFSETI